MNPSSTRPGIVVATGPADDADPLLRTATSIAAAAQGNLSWVMLDRVHHGGSELRHLTASDLLVVDPRHASRCPAAGLDGRIGEVIRSCAAPTLSVRDASAWPPREILVAFDAAALDEGALEDVGAWISRFCVGSVESRGVDVHLLFVSDSADAMHDALPGARGLTERLRRDFGDPSDAQLSACVRWGADPRARIASWIERTGPDLAILAPSRATGAPSLDGDEWSPVRGHARCNLLVLPWTGNSVTPGDADARHRFMLRAGVVG